MRYPSLAAVVLIAAALACSEENRLPHEPVSPPDPSLGTARISDKVQLTDHIAKLIATSMRSAEVRALVRDAMRSSRVTEHKLVLQDFVQTRQGKTFLNGLGKVSGVGTNQVASWIKSLPRLDFYVPTREHRLAWRGGPDAAVTSNMSNTPPQTAYAVTGGLIPVQLSKQIPSAQALFMLQGEEHKNKRINPQADAPGLVIQEPGDGELGISYADVNAFGVQGPIIQVADLEAVGGTGRIGENAECNPDVSNCSPGDPGGGAGPIYTYLKRIDTGDICDNGNCGESNEFEFRSVAASGKTRIIWINNVPSTGTKYPYNTVLLYGNPPYDGTVKVYTKETDSSSNDDHWVYVIEVAPYYVGPAPVTSNDNNRWWYHKESPWTDARYPYRLALYISWYPL